MTARDQLAGELKKVIRLAAREPESLIGGIPTLERLGAPDAEIDLTDLERVEHVIQRVIPAYLDRLPDNRDCRAIRELFAWENDEGELQSLTTRYHKSSKHLVTAPADFGRRQEPRLLRECARHFISFDRQDRLERRSAGTEARTKAAGHEVPLTDRSLSPLAQRMWTRTNEEYERRLAGIQTGMLWIRGQEDLLDLLTSIADAADRTLHALDQSELERWFGDARLQRYLDEQLDRARIGGLRVERIRALRRGDLEDPRRRSYLREFMRLHDEAGAALYLCPEEALRRLDTDFLPRDVNSRMDMVLIDIDTTPACLTSSIGEHGFVERSLLYFRALDPVRAHYADWLRVKEAILRYRYNERVDDALAIHRDDPLPPRAEDLAHGPGDPLAPRQ